MAAQNVRDVTWKPSSAISVASLWHLFLLFSAAGSLALFLRLAFGTSIDIALHCRIAQHSLVTGTWLPNFLYYWAIAGLALFSQDLWALKVSAAVVLTAAVVVKLHLSYCVARAWLGQEASDHEARVAVLCGLTGLSFSFPRGSSWFLGQIPPTVWHNSTTIAVAPFALALFWSTYRYLVCPEPRWLAFATALVAVNALVKPSFLFCVIPVFALMLLLRFGLRRATWAGMTPVVVAVLLMAFQYWMLFEGPRDESVLYPQGAGVAVAPLQQWRAFTNNVSASLVLSLAFPLSVVAFRWRDVRRSLLFGYAACCLIAGLVIFALLAEQGPRQGHGNFFWQAVLSNYVLFLAGGLVCLRGTPLSRAFVAEWRRQPLATRGRLLVPVIPIAVLVAHAMFGTLYLARLAVRGLYR